MIYDIAKKHSNATARVVHKCKLCDKDFHSFYILREHKRKEHGAQSGSGAESVDVAQLMGYVDDNCLKEELGTCKHFLLDSEMEDGRHRVSNFAIDTLDPKYLLGKLDVVFDSLKCAAELNVAFGFVPKNLGDGSCRYYYAHEKNTILERSNFLATTEDLTKIKYLLSNNDVLESCKRERANTKWKFYKLKIVTIFPALLKQVPMGFKDTVLPDPLLKNHSVKCLKYEENTRRRYNDKLCFFGALALHLHKNERLEKETSKLFNLFLERTDEIDPANFRGACMEDIEAVEDFVHTDIFLTILTL